MSEDQNGKNSNHRESYERVALVFGKERLSLGEGIQRWKNMMRVGIPQGTGPAPFPALQEEERNGEG